jgi:cell division protein FtsW (lipid II flippase)
MKRSKRDILVLCGSLVGWVGAAIWSYKIWNFAPCLSYFLLLCIATLIFRTDYVNKIRFWFAVGLLSRNPSAGSRTRLFVDSFEFAGKKKRAKRLIHLAKMCGVRVPRRRKAYELPPEFEFESPMKVTDLPAVFKEI